ncbi:MAG: HD domain-containing protein, partial [Chlorobi bacterium]|nr:HD domain-containing protein [Chlorobiota bacterium]
MEKLPRISSPWIETSRKAGVFIKNTVPEEVDWCVLALGSLARYELTEKSDWDILVVTEKQEDAEEISRWLHHLMDHHASICAVVRSEEECLHMLYEDFRSWIGIIEARPLGGTMQPWYRLRKALSRQIRELPRSLWREKLRQSIETRHKRYGKSVRLLEPNIKNSAGGLRDIHTIFWFTLLDAYQEIVQSCPDFTPRFSTVLKRSPLHERRQQIINRAREFYLRVRFTMHELTGTLQDYLDYDLQQQVAVKLGYGSEITKEAVETFMQEYLRNAREVHLTLEKLFPPVSPGIPMIVSIHGLREENGVLRVADSSLKVDNRFIAEVFDFAHGHPGVIGEDVTRKIDMEMTQRKIRPDRHSSAFLRKLFTLQEPVADRLIHLNNKNILGSWIPEFGQLVSFFQHNIYHYYTADEHTLLALKACENLGEEEGYIADIYRQQEDKTAIKLGIFFHDIAKPVSIADHEKKGAKIVRCVLPKMGLEQYVDETAFIVRHHLLMEQVAFRRDIHDEGTVNRFVETVKTPERLDRLILMTYADLCAVNPKVWTPWKEHLLCELHGLALQKMTRTVSDKSQIKTSRKQVGEVEETGTGIPSQRERRTLREGEELEIIFRHENSYSVIT